MKASLLANYVIICVAVSAIILLASYIGLTWTIKAIPPEMTTLISSLATGAFAATTLKNKLQSDALLPLKQSTVDYVLMGLATTTVILVFNYNLLIWAERVISKELAPTIGALSTAILTATTFRDLDFDRSNN